MTHNLLTFLYRIVVPLKTAESTRQEHLNLALNDLNSLQCEKLNLLSAQEDIDFREQKIKKRIKRLESVKPSAVVTEIRQIRQKPSRSRQTP